MTYGLWLSTAGMQINDYRRSVMANNLANVNTVGFKHDLAVIQERLIESKAGAGGGRFAHGLLDNLTGGAFVRPTIHTFEQGGLSKTSNPLDLAIEGDGFFVVRDAQTTQYTRDGRFTLNKEGELVMVAGQGRFRALDVQGIPIRLPDANGRRITVSGDGTIRMGDEEIAQIGLVDFDDRSQLTKVGGNRYRNDASPTRPAAGTIRSEHVEQSTFNPIAGLAQMIEVSRAYELNARMLSLQDFTIGQAVTTVGRVG
ncbi:MAG: flagellar hook basal-body protein [Planctomycetes bacterium]|nr:flagellar hook basal-body protein [Planctomycetota bacterium]